MATIEDLMLLIQEMSNKIDNLENKIDELRERGGGGGNGSRKPTVSVVPDFIPDLCFQKWLQTFDIGKQDIMVLLETNIVDGFKCCLIKFIGGKPEDTENVAKPIWVSTNGRYKQIYIYDVVDGLDQHAQWRIMTEDDVCILIDTIWRKMIEYYFVTEEETLDILSDDEQTYRDLNKKVLLDSKKRLLKHTRELQRCIVERCFG